MEYALLGFFTGLSLILALGAQNIFVIEQGLKKQHVFLVCLICSLSLIHISEPTRPERIEYSGVWV